jgi:hypothetical protein
MPGVLRICSRFELIEITREVNTNNNSLKRRCLRLQCPPPGPIFLILTGIEALGVRLSAET